MKTGAWLKRLALAACWLMLPHAAPAAEFSFGVFPNFSARVLVETYQPLGNYLGGALGQPVHLESAPDFFTFHERTLAGDYDLVLTAPHMAWLAWKEGGYKPILIYKEPVRGFVVVRTDSPYEDLPDLRGKRIAIPDPNAVVNIRMEKILAQAGLGLGRELTVTEAGSHTNAATYVDERQADAAIVGYFPFKRLPQTMQDKLRVLAETPALPGLVFLVRPRTPAAREQAIRQAIEKFMLGEEGQAFLRKTGAGGVRPLNKNELMQVESDAQVFKRRFQAQAHPAGKAQ